MPALRSIIATLLLSSALLGQNMALKVDGMNSALSIPQHASLEPPTELTIEAWVKGEGSLSHGRIIRKSDDFGPGYQLSWSFQSNRVSSQLVCSGVTTIFDPLPNTTYLGAWHHFAMTAKAGGLVTLYIDGVLVNSGNAPANCMSHSGGLWFGAFQGVSEEFIGEIDEVRLWNVERTAAEIQDSMFDSLQTGVGLVSSWNMDGSGMDSVGGNHGSLFGNAVFVPSNAPVSVFKFSPPSADWRGGTTVTLEGNLAGAFGTPTVSFGSAMATDVVVVSNSIITAKLPAATEPGVFVPIVVSSGTFLATATTEFEYTPRLIAPRRISASGSLNLHLALDPPAEVIVLSGRPSPQLISVPQTDWFLEILGPNQIFMAIAPLQSDLGFAMPVTGLTSAIGITVRIQALVTSLAPGAVSPTYTNSVDMRVY